MVVSKRKFGDLSEKKLAKKTGGRVTIGSGSVWADKGDVEVIAKNGKKYLFQNKATAKDHFPITMKLLQKIKDDANTKNADAILSIEMQGEWVYCFERTLISEKCEQQLNLQEIEVNKQVTIDTSSNLLLNNAWIIIAECYFNHKIKKDLKLL